MRCWSGTDTARSPATGAPRRRRRHRRRSAVIVVGFFPICCCPCSVDGAGRGTDGGALIVTLRGSVFPAVELDEGRRVTSGSGSLCSTWALPAGRGWSALALILLGSFLALHGASAVRSRGSGRPRSSSDLLLRARRPGEAGRLQSAQKRSLNLSGSLRRVLRSGGALGRSRGRCGKDGDFLWASKEDLGCRDGSRALVGGGESGPRPWSTATAHVDDAATTSSPRQGSGRLVPPRCWR